LKGYVRRANEANTPTASADFSKHHETGTAESFWDDHNAETILGGQQAASSAIRIARFQRARINNTFARLRAEAERRKREQSA
ncbi:MAG: hypothetical protein HRU13_00130, partial [Phycisphaerales bacterium]|nr:hypothetical protein [Phycisphaerales bacterium]